MITCVDEWVVEIDLILEFKTRKQTKAVYF